MHCQHQNVLTSDPIGGRSAGPPEEWDRFSHESLMVAPPSEMLERVDDFRPEMRREV
jgi:hypothetical protein